MFLLSFVVGSVYNDAVVVLFNRQQNVGMNENQLEMISIGKEVGRLHNACLDVIYNDFTGEGISRSIADEAIKNRFLASVNKFIKMNSEATRTDFVDVEITMDSVDKTIEDIKATLSVREKFYIDKALSLDMSNSDLVNNLLIEISTDQDLMNKQAVICFVTVLEASTHYWNSHIEEWQQMLDKPVTRVNWGTVATFDAWYGYQAMLVSAMNPIVSGGTAAFASGLAAVFS